MIALTSLPLSAIMLTTPTLPQYDVICSPPSSIMNVDGIVFFGAPVEGENTTLYQSEVNGSRRVAVIEVTAEGYNLVVSKEKAMVTFKYFCDRNGRYVPAPSGDESKRYAHPRVRFK